MIFCSSKKDGSVVVLEVMHCAGGDEGLLLRWRCLAVVVVKDLCYEGEGLYLW